MIDVAIVGGGLCGLSLAWRLRSRRSFALFEARDRFGGRILSVQSRIVADLGPSWIWPESQPNVKRLIADLGLSTFPQHDEGDVLLLRDPDDRPDTVSSDPVHGGAHRIKDGMGRLTESLVAHIGPDQLHLGHVLTAVSNEADRVVLHFRTASGPATCVARQVVLALPPRLLAENVRFDPNLDGSTQDAMIETATWMADQAKVVVGYDRAFWREAGRSGNGFVIHETAVLSEVFDACEAAPERAALGGFLALTPDMRDSFSAGLPLLIGNQIVQLFGPQLEDGEQHYQDWATEPFTCGVLDRGTDHRQPIGVANPLLRRSLWNGKLFLAGSETAGQAAGLMEGALEAARHVEDALAPTERPDMQASNAGSIARFQAWVTSQRDPTFDSYRRHLDRGRAFHQTAPITQQAILGAIEELFSNALGLLFDLPFDAEGLPVERGRSALTPLVQAPFRAVIQSFLDDVTAFNQTSQSLAGFTDEQILSHEYMQAILREVADAWRSFSLTANRLLLAKAAILRAD